VSYTARRSLYTDWLYSGQVIGKVHSPYEIAQCSNPVQVVVVTVLVICTIIKT